VSKRNLFLAASILLIGSGVTGCAGKMPPAADPQTAATSLKAALEAWKLGETPQTLEAKEPAIYFNDQVWSSGGELVDYSITDQQANGQGWNCEVQLTLRNGHRKSESRRVRYQIDTQPHIVIVQQP
jgi:hypothetical protein